MNAFHGKESVKEKYLERVRAHRKADQLIRGIYWNGGKGCAVGCTVHSGNHQAYETELGIPELIARIEDGLFERIPNAKAMEWPEKFLSAIPVGADLSKVAPLFMIWLLSDEQEGIIRGIKNEKVLNGIKQVVRIYEKKMQGIEITAEDRIAALAALDERDALVALVALVARAALDAFVALDALAALAALDERDERDALTPEQRKNYAEARDRMFVRMSEKLIELLMDAPVLTNADQR